MKRFFLLSTLLLATLMICAQTKIAPKMKKGMKKVYVVEATIGVPSKQSTKITTETVYEVVDATNDGYVLDVYVTDVKTDAKDAESRVYSLATEMLKDVHTQYATNKDGKVTKILNAEEGKKRINEMLDKVLADVPLPASTTLTNLKKQLTGNINEASLLESVQTLNGKTISTGTEEEYKTEQGIKMKRTYSVKDKSSIQTNAKINMNTDDMKKMVMGLVEKIVPNQSENLMDMIGPMINNLKIDAAENSTYTFQKDGGVNKNIKTVRFTKINGANKQLEKVVAELEKHPELHKYLAQSGAFYWRPVRGAKRLSAHSYGMTIDIGVKFSDYWRSHAKDENATVAYRNKYPHEIVEIFEKYGFIWGGRWYHYDTMHFEYRPEILMDARGK